MSYKSFMDKLKKKKKTVEMPAKEFHNEHKKLPKILRAGTPGEREQEAKKQESEARKERLLKGFKKK